MFSPTHSATCNVLDIAVGLNRSERSFTPWYLYSVKEESKVSNPTTCHSEVHKREKREVEKGTTIERGMAFYLEEVSGTDTWDKVWKEPWLQMPWGYLD